MQLLEYYLGEDLAQLGFVHNGSIAQHAMVLSEKIAQARATKGGFVLGLVSGDGDLTTGQCGEDLYLSVVNATLHPLFESVAGMRFEVRQISLGSGSNAQASLLPCLATHLGRDVDLVHVSKMAFDPQALVQELSLEDSGALIHFLTTTTATQSNKRMLHTIRKLLPPNTANWLNLGQLQEKMGGKEEEWGQTSLRYVRTRLGKPGIVWKNWLPGTLGHQFLADATSMLFIHALEMLENVGVAPSSRAPAYAGGGDGSSQCYSTHTPRFGEDSSAIAVKDAGQWRLLPGERISVEEDAPINPEPCAIEKTALQEAYFESRGARTGKLIFTIPSSLAGSSSSSREVYVCCCCSHLCAEEQLKPPNLVRFEWSNPQAVVSATATTATVNRSGCLLIAHLLPGNREDANTTTTNELSISVISNTVDIPIRIARVFLSPPIE